GAETVAIVRERPEFAGPLAGIAVADASSAAERADITLVIAGVFGIGLVFVLGIGVLLLGVVIMIVQAIRHPAFFRGETLKQGLHAE
ncbi:hypothetical protein KCW65_21670, partial [Mycobacterium tuberculosis]|nr:hypothetical protein [Mycobacterium tuberculosis]